MMKEDFISIKEKISRTGYAIETRRNLFNNHRELIDNINVMKSFLDNVISEYRLIKDNDIVNNIDYFLDLEFFGDFLRKGDRYTALLNSYITVLSSIRNDISNT